MVPLTKRKAGRPPEYVQDDNGNPIVGLSCQPNSAPATRDPKTCKIIKRGEIIGQRFYLTTSKPKAEKSGAKVNCTLDGIRDGAQQACDLSDCDPFHTEMLMGHELSGVSRKYKKRTPEKTAKNVAAIHAYYRIAELVKIARL